MEIHFWGFYEHINADRVSRFPIFLLLKFSGLVKNTKAYQQWPSEEYLLSLKVPANNTQRIEINKVQDSTKPTIQMHFHDFVEIYKLLPYYMVDTLPTFMR